MEKCVTSPLRAVERVLWLVGRRGGGDVRAFCGYLAEVGVQFAVAWKCTGDCVSMSVRNLSISGSIDWFLESGRY